MKINKIIKAKVQRDYFFAEGDLDINCAYFIREIEKGSNQDNNANYKTNVKGRMTSPYYFMRDKEFVKTLQPILDLIDGNIKDSPPYGLDSAWGYREGFGEYTREHDHISCWLSGVIYLNKHHQKLMFPEIKKEVAPKEGNFILFSSFLLHKTRRNTEENFKYGLAFNFKQNGVFDNLTT
tara:strand:+ start:228 stop:767 length:540 start_codon:yes stop_codon:yes gene_type:complete